MRLIRRVLLGALAVAVLAGCTRVNVTTVQPPPPPPAVVEAPKGGKWADALCIQGIWLDSVRACVFKHLCGVGKCLDDNPTSPEKCQGEVDKVKACLGLSQ